MRKWNWNAGPSQLPEEVLEEAREALLELGGTGVGVLELGHRTPHYDEVHHGAAQAVLRLLELDPRDWTCLFLGGGASMQFAQIPMNLGRRSDHVVTGLWAQKAFDEARILGPARLAATSAGTKHDRIPERLELDPGASYLHVTTNNTVYGTQWRALPECAVPLVVDMSSDICSRRLDLSRASLIFAGAQKNLGAAGATIVAIRKELLARTPADVPHMLSYRAHHEAKGIYNTPPVFAIWLVGRMAAWIERQGGVAALEAVNERKAAALYRCLDSHPLWVPLARPQDRSRMNVTWRLSRPELEPVLIQEADAAGLLYLAGHRSAGGFRASLYNAMPERAVAALVAFLEDFARRRG